VEIKNEKENSERSWSMKIIGLNVFSYV